MPGSVRVILEPLPSGDTLRNVSTARMRLFNNGPGVSLATESPQPAELSFSLASITRVRPPGERTAQPLATVSGQLSVVNGRPRFEVAGDVVSLVPPDQAADRQLQLELDSESFPAGQPLLLALPQPAEGVKTLEMSVDLKVGGALEGGAVANDLFDFGDIFGVSIIEPKIVSLIFRSDHGVMKDNNTDLLNTGSPIPGIEWKFGQPSKPISHTKNRKVDIEIDLEVHPFNADETDCTLEGKADFAPLDFKLVQKLKGGKHTLSLTSTQALPDRIDKLQGKIKWTLTTPKKTFSAGDTFGHTIYLTFGTPVSIAGREAGITERRVATSVEFIKKNGATAPHKVVEALMKNDFPAYTVDVDATLDPTLKHPKYFNDVGGAWRILENLAAAAECQAIVRVVKAMIAQVGMDGTAVMVLATVKPDTGDPIEQPESGTGLAGKETVVSGKTLFPFLVPEEPGKVGRTFVIGARDSPVLNFFEACLKFTEGGLTKLYPGGTEGESKDTIPEVIEFSFTALILVSDAGGFTTADGKTAGIARLERVIRRY